MKVVSILGSTGSIGCNTLKVIDHLREFRVAALGAGRNMPKLAEQISKYRPQLVSVEDQACAEDLGNELKKLDVAPPKVLVGQEGLVEVATHPQADVVVSAAVGAVGFVPTLRALEVGKRVALANKETLVMAGELMTRTADASGAEILPVDSEHNAIHQCLRGGDLSEVKRLILTASGGPFRTWSADKMHAATVDDALAHPNWSMGDKITIDSATLMNKGLEVIEAKWLFGFEADQISVVVHPQSVVHSMVEFIDGSVIAQLGATDMKHPIQYALTHPNRRKGCNAPLDLARLGNLSFEEPDLERFPCLGLAYRALRKGGTAAAALNAANEIAVEAFLAGKIGFGEIAEISSDALDRHENTAGDGLDGVLAADAAARSRAIIKLSCRAALREANAV